MVSSAGYILFAVAPLVLGGILLWRYPKCRRVRARAVLLYLVVMSLLIYGALRFVAYVASATVSPVEVLVVLWFAISWRLAWELWARTVGRVGQRWVRWARLRRHKKLHAPLFDPADPARPGNADRPHLRARVPQLRRHPPLQAADGQDPMTIYPIPFENVRIPTADGLTLDGWFIAEPGADRTIVICHGAGANKGNFIWFLGPLARHGYNVVFFDFRAHGASDGRTTTYGIRERRDVQAVVDWLKLNRPEQSKIIVGLGSSQGSMALALAAAEDRRIDAIILDSPFTSPYELAHHHARRVPVLGPALVNIIMAGMCAQTGTNFFTASATQAVSSLGNRPVMVIHGDQDVMMPASHSQQLYDAATGPREIWFGPGPHSNIITTDPQEYGTRVFAFLDNHLSMSSGGDTSRR